MYEIRLVGRLGPALRLAFLGLRADIDPRHSVLITRAGGEDLPALLVRLRRRGVEVTACHRIGLTGQPAGPGLPGRGESSAGAARHPRGADTKEAVAVPAGPWEIHVSGVVPDSVLAEMEGLEALDATVEPTTTVLYGWLPDEAALYGVLDRVQSLGLRLVEVRSCPGSGGRPEPLTRPHRGEAADPALGPAESDDTEGRR
jgi:hypothetical protein